MENKTKTFNKYAKWTILSFVGSILFFWASFVYMDAFSPELIMKLPLMPWENESLMRSIFSGIWDFSIFLYICAVILFILSPVFGSVASIQTHKNKEKGGFISLLITGILILFIISQVLI